MPFKHPLNLNNKLNDQDDQNDVVIEDHKCPETMEELLLKQWDLGAELCMEQTKNFDSKFLKLFISNLKKLIQKF